MTLAAAFDDLKTKQVRLEGDGKEVVGGATLTRFFGSRGVSPLPQAVLAQFDPGKVSRAHFHIVDQFQVVIGGKGKLGRHDLAPYCVHFSRAYTPYGPLLSDASSGMTVFTLRRHHDPGSQRLPEKQGMLKAVPARQPWQATREINFPTLQSGTASANTMLRAVPGIQDDMGLAAYTLNMGPNTEARAPDPSQGDGQYLIVAKGSLLHDNRELKAWALLFVEADEAPLRLHAGSEGLEAIILNFPKPRTSATGTSRSVRATTGLKIWQCTQCSFVYDEAAGLPEDGIVPGTRWQDVPESWNCPDCSASKGDFQMMEMERIATA